VDASRPFPLGISVPRTGSPATDDPQSACANVAVYAPGVATLEIAYCAPGGTWQLKTLPNITNDVHHGIVDGFPVGSRYGFRSSSEDDALPVSVPTVAFDDDGEQPLLLDPYGRAVDQSDGFLSNVRMSSGFDWGGDRSPHVSWRNTIIYEAHVRGQSMLHPDIPEDLRGTYAGMAHPAMIEHLTGLGITSVQLLPVHFHLDEPHLQNLGMTNYWGYNTAAFFAPHPDYATQAAQAAGPQAVQDEFKGMVKLLHAAGLEVILDVVYNHTAEGGPDGQTLSFRGLGEKQYYRNDGHGDNRSYNHGFEGPTEDEEILALRAQTSRNLMATLMVSMGIPMITAGDEIGRTQQGNNNAYCQDNPITWLDWTSTPESHAMLRSTKRVIRLRKEFLAGQPHHYPSRDKQAYLHWFDEHGKPMSMDQWNDPQHRVVQLLLGSDDGQVDGLVVVNGSAHDIKITLPDVSNDDGTGKRLFELRLTTSELHDRRQGVRVAAGERDVAQSNTISIYRT
jgi:pullulanase/glycogen debranching enzyme